MTANPMVGQAAPVICCTIVSRRCRTSVAVVAAWMFAHRAKARPVAPDTRNWLTPVMNCRIADWLLALASTVARISRDDRRIIATSTRPRTTRNAISPKASGGLIVKTPNKAPATDATSSSAVIVASGTASEAMSTALASVMREVTVLRLCHDIGRRSIRSHTADAVTATPRPRMRSSANARTARMSRSPVASATRAHPTTSSVDVV